MATLYRRGRTWWVDYRVGGRRVQRSLKTTHRKIADEALKAIEGDLVRGAVGIPVKGSGTERVKDAYLEEQASRVSRTWLSALRTRLTAFLADTGVRRMDDASPRVIEAWLRHRRETISPVRARWDYEILRAWLRWALRMGYLVTNPMDRVTPPPRKVRKEVRFLSRDEAAALLAACRGPVLSGHGARRERRTPLGEMVAVAIYSGLRLGEIRTLRWEDVNSQDDVIHVRVREDFAPKDREGRRIPLHPTLHRALEEFRADAEERHGPIFTTSSGSTYHKDNLVRYLKGAARQAGLSGVTWNTLRHTFASWLAMEGVSLFKIARFLGHSTVRTTEQYYAGLVPEDLHEDIRVLGDIADTHVVPHAGQR